jgi:hypothetical protein
MHCDTALPSPVLFALKTIEDYIDGLPDDIPEENRELTKLTARLTSSLISFASKRNLRYPIGD